MTPYKRLGDYIREVNVIGTYLSNYMVIKREQFACSLMQVPKKTISLEKSETCTNRAFCAEI